MASTETNLIVDVDNIEADEVAANDFRTTTSTTDGVVNVTLNTLTPIDKGELILKPGTTSDVWLNFKWYSKAPELACCNHCRKDVAIGKSQSTSKLTSHMISRHPQLTRGS
jgi:hypothetical protein